MGIIKLTKFFNEYINSLPKTHNQIISEICYIDYTANLVITTSNISRRYSKSIQDHSSEFGKIIHEICNQIIDTCVNNIIEQIVNNKYFKKYIIVFDYKYISKFNPKFQFNDNLIDDYISQLPFQKDHIDSIPMIPKNLNIKTTPIIILKESVRNLYELRLKNCITEYQNLYYLLENTPETDVNALTILHSIIKFGLYRYIVLRGAKNNTRRDRGIKTMCKTIHSHKSFMESRELGNVLDNINVRLYSSFIECSQKMKMKTNEMMYGKSEDSKDFKMKMDSNETVKLKDCDLNPDLEELTPEKFETSQESIPETSQESKFEESIHETLQESQESIPETFFEKNIQNDYFKNFKLTLNNFKNTVNYPLIVNLIPILVSRIKSEIKTRGIKTQVDFIGCENESDFVIRKHILLYNSLNCPTIYTTDSDLFMLLCDVNCYIRIKSSNLNIRIKPNLFWQWLTGLKNIYLNDIIAFCCILGNDYNHFRFTKYRVDTLDDIRELFKNNKNLYLNIYNHAIKLYQKYVSISNENENYKTEPPILKSFEKIDSYESKSKCEYESKSKCEYESRCESKSKCESKPIHFTNHTFTKYKSVPSFTDSKSISKPYFVGYSISENTSKSYNQNMKNYKSRPISRGLIAELLHFLISLDMYIQCDLIENEIHYISTINKNAYNKLIDETIELKYRNIFTDNW